MQAHARRWEILATGEKCADLLGPAADGGQGCCSAVTVLEIPTYSSELAIRQ